MLALVIASNMSMIAITHEANYIVSGIHFCLALIALAHAFFFSSLPRSKPSFYTINHEDFDVAQPAFMNYLVSILEFFYYALLVYFVAQPLLLAFFAPTQPAYITALIFFALLYLVSLILAKILLVSRIIVGADLYESRILPLSFLFFGMSYIYRAYFI